MSQDFAMFEVVPTSTKSQERLNALGFHGNMGVASFFVLVDFVTTYYLV